MGGANAATEGDATSGVWQSGAGTGRPFPEARLMDIGRLRRAHPQPRVWFDPAELQHLANSIREHGILTPLIVRPDPEHPGEFLLIVGERRLRAARALELTEVPVLIRTGVSNDQAFIQALVENLQRADLTPDERYNALKHLEGRGLSQREIGRRLGYDHTTINRQLRIRENPVLGPAVATARIKASQGQELLQAPPTWQGPLIDLIVARREAGRPISMPELRTVVRAMAEESTTETSTLKLNASLAPAPTPAPGGIPAPSVDWSTTLTRPESDELHRIAARAAALNAHVKQELQALRGYLDHPQVAAELTDAASRLMEALGE